MQFAVVMSPPYKPFRIPVLPALRTSPLASITREPPSSRLPLAHRFVCPSNPLPPTHVRPLDVIDTWPPGSCNCHSSELIDGVWKRSVSGFVLEEGGKKGS